MPKPSKRLPLSFDPNKIPGASAAASPPEDEAMPPKAAKGKGRAGRQFIAAHVVPEAAKQFKLLAVQHDRTTQDLLVEAINDLFAKYGLSRIAGD
jgi:hypothetical protein